MTVALHLLALVAVVLGLVAAMRLDRPKGGTPGPLGMIDRGLMGLIGLTVLTLAVTGFGFAALRGVALAGAPLLVHASAGMGLAVMLAVAAVVWAERARLGVAIAGRRFASVRRVCLWAMLGLGLGVIVSAGMMMMPWFGTHGIERLIALHRLAGLLVLAPVAGFVAGCGKCAKQ